MKPTACFSLNSIIFIDWSYHYWQKVNSDGDGNRDITAARSVIGKTIPTKDDTARSYHLWKESHLNLQ